MWHSIPVSSVMIYLLCHDQRTGWPSTSCLALQRCLLHGPVLSAGIYETEPLRASASAQQIGHFHPLGTRRSCRASVINLETISDDLDLDLWFCLPQRTPIRRLYNPPFKGVLQSPLIPATPGHTKAVAVNRGNRRDWRQKKMSWGARRMGG